MSLGTFFAKVWKGIKNLFKDLSPKAKWAIHFGATFVDQVKSGVENPFAGLLTQLIPGDNDDKILALVKANITPIAVNLKLIDAATATGLTPEEVTAKLTEAVQSIDKDYRKDFYNTLAIRVALAAADGDVTWDELQHTMKWYYDTKLSKGKPFTGEDFDDDDDDVQDANNVNTNPLPSLAV